MRTNARRLATVISLATGRGVYIRDRKVQRKWGTRRCKESRAIDLGRRTIYLFDPVSKPHSKAQRLLAKIGRECSGTLRERIGGRIA